MSPCNSSEEKWNMLQNTVYNKGMEIFYSRKKKPPEWFHTNMDTISPALDHKRSARLIYLDNPSADNLAKLKDAQTTAQHTTREAQKSFWNDICLSVQNCSDCGDSATMHAALKCAMGPMSCLTASLKILNDNVLHEKSDQLDHWIKYFSQLYSSEFPFDSSALDFLDQVPVLNHLNICPEISEVISALKALKSGKVSGSEGYTTRASKM